MTTLHLELGSRGYDIYIGRGLLNESSGLFDLDRKVLIVTDTGVPREYSETVKNACANGRILTVEQGEGSKGLDAYSMLLKEMVDFGMTRTDCVVAVGGGVIGDLAGFVASSYMRGIDFYNIPTTLLSQVDSSIGGKTAINFGGIKNIVGSFYQPKGVIIDVSTLRSLPKRQIANGLAEVIKMAVTCDKKLFELIEKNEITEDILEKIIINSLLIKKSVVEADEREMGLRKILNFGHTVGHAIEAYEKGGLYHGECVSIGMTAVCSEGVKKRLLPILKKLDLPTKYSGNLTEALKLISHDKKCDADRLSIVFSDDIGSYRIEKISVQDFITTVNKELK